jgi:hypothetical protein
MTIEMRVRFGAFALAVAAWGVAAEAHHSPAAYDMRTELVLEGTIAAFSWRNPHSSIELETTGPDGVKVRRDIEVAGISILQPLGLTGDSIRVGERVVIAARPNRRSSDGVVLGVSLRKEDGVELPLRFMGRGETVNGSAPAATSVIGRWLGRESDFVAYRTNVLESWPLTNDARSALAASDGGRVTSRADCVPYGPPAVLMEPVLTTLEIQGNTAVLTTDTDGNALQRVIHLDLAEHPAGLQPTFSGHSIGRWENDALVVDTVGFEPHPHGFGFGVPSSSRKHLVERFALSDDHRQLVYETTIEDPETFTEPVRFTARLDHRPDLRPSGSPCDLEAARRYLDE